MLPLVKTKPQKIKNYQGIVKKELLQEIEALANDLKGLKVVMINSTSQGGGVAEILKSLIPLMKGVGIKAEWHTIPPQGRFFEITKEIHNALQGKKYKLPQKDQKEYLKNIQRICRLTKNMKADIWVVHDPQPSGIISCLPGLHPSICHIHIDLSFPNQKAWKFINSFLKEYDKIIFTSKEFVQKEIKEKSEVFTPTINPLSEKNKPLEIKKAKLIVKKFGVDIQKPLVSQISRFDPWKDPLGVIKAYKLAKKKIPGLQLALIGLFLAQDDPEAVKIFKKVKKEKGKDSNIFLFSDPKKLKGLKVDFFVSAFQTASDVILQKSTREGFGLTVSESMWKGKAVIGGKVGGIKLQIKNNKNGFLVSNQQQAAEKIVQLIKNPQLSERLGKKAKETVREKFLMPRLLRDYLKLFKKII